MKKILGLTVAAVLVMALVGGGTWAYFSDVETASSNILSAGTLDLSIDGGNADVSMTLSASDIAPGETSGSSPGTCNLKNIGSVSGDLTIVSGSLIQTESTGTTGTANALGTTTTLIHSTLGGSDGDWVGYYLRCTSGTNDGEAYIVTDYVTASGTLTVGTAFSVAPDSDDTYALHTEEEYDGDPGELGGYVDLSIWLDTDGDGMTSGYESGTDVQLLAGNTFNSDARVWGTGTMVSLAGQTWTDCITDLAQGSYVDLYVEWDFDDDGDQNDAQGDSADLGFTFTLAQP